MDRRSHHEGYSCISSYKSRNRVPDEYTQGSYARLALLCSCLQGKNAQSDERNLPTFLPFFVQHLLLFLLQQNDQDSHQDISPILSTPTKDAIQQSPMGFYQDRKRFILVGKAKRSLDQKGIALVALVAKGFCHSSFFYSREGIEKSFNLLLLNLIKCYHLLHFACLSRKLNL
jgi:hypothetical protein